MPPCRILCCAIEWSSECVLESCTSGSFRYFLREAYRQDDDSRLKLIDSSWISGKSVLDIGCNTGNITIEVARLLKPRLIEGIDVDHNLIRDAQKKHAALMKEQEESVKPNTIKLAFVPRAVIQKNSATTTSESNKKDGTLFPRNIVFKPVDILDCPTGALGEKRYDTILCLSVTKWIQLNKGDDGLRLLFKTAFNLLQPGGMFLLEYQPWKSYVKNRNTSAITKAMFPTLQIKPEDFESLLLEDGFVVNSRLGTSLAEAKGFNRPFLVLNKPVVMSEEQLDLAGEERRSFKKTCDRKRKRSIERINIVEKKLCYEIRENGNDTKNDVDGINSDASSGPTQKKEKKKMKKKSSKNKSDKSRRSKT